MNNKDYNNKNRELQIYHGSLDNYEESGNTHNDYDYNNLQADYETNPDELGNITEDSYTKPYYSDRFRKTREIRNNKNAMPIFLIGSFLFFLFLVTTGIISFSLNFTSETPKKEPPKAHLFMSLTKISMPMMDGKFESELKTADLAAVKHAITIGRARLKDLLNYSKGWEEKTNQSFKNIDIEKYRNYKSGLDFNKYQIDKIEKQLSMLEKKKLELEAVKE